MVKQALIVDRIDDGSRERRTRAMGGPPMLVDVPKMPETLLAKNMLRLLAAGDQPTRLKPTPARTVTARSRDSP